MSLRTVTPVVSAISAGCVTLILASILHLERCDVQQDRVALHSLHVDFPAPHSLRIHCIGEFCIVGADDLDFLGWGCRQVHRPPEMLLRRSLVASYVAANADWVTFSSVQWSFLNCYFSLANAELSLQGGGRKGNKNRLALQFPVRHIM